MEACKEDFVEIMVIEEKKDYDHGDGETSETQISETVSEGAPCSETDSDGFSESDHETEMEGSLVDDYVKEESSCEVDVVTQILETVTDCSDSVEMVMFSESEHDMEETLVDEYVEEVQEKVNKDEDESGCFSSEVIGMMNGSEDENDVGEETLKGKEECQDLTEVISMMEKTTKVPYNRKQKPCNQEEPEASISWTINKCKKPVEETDDLREFNPREPNYLPVVVDADGEKVDLKHQDMDERKNSEDWMFDYALQRTVSKLSSARKRKVALLVEAFETVQPVTPHDTEPAAVLSYGRHLQACN